MDGLTHEEKGKMIAMLNHSLTSQEEFDRVANKMFDDADVNKDDIVDKDELEIELKKMAKVFGLPEPNKDTVEIILKKYDANHSGNIDRLEWKVFFKNALENFLHMTELKK